MINFADSFRSFSQMMELLPVFPPCSGLFRSLVIKLIELMSESIFFFLYVLFLERILRFLFEDEKNLMASCYNLTNFYNRH